MLLKTTQGNFTSIKAYYVNRSILAINIIDKKKLLTSDVLYISLMNFLYPYFYIFMHILISLELRVTNEYCLVGKHIPAICNAKGTMMVPDTVQPLLMQGTIWLYSRRHKLFCSTLILWGDQINYERISWKTQAYTGWWYWEGCWKKNVWKYWQD